MGRRLVVQLKGLSIISIVSYGMESEAPSSSSFKPTTTAILFLAIGLLAGLLIGLNLPSILPTTQQTDQSQEEPSFIRVEGVSADDDPFQGAPDAPVTIIEFSDFQCPFCGRFFENTLPEIKRNYIDTGKVKFVYRDFPLENIHPSANKAAEAANCASDQGKFWEYHDLLFANQPVWAAGNATVEFKKYASTLGLDEVEFSQCLDSGKYTEEILKDLQDGLDAGVNGTPTLFINGVKVVGARSYDTFKEVIDAELKK